MYIIILLLVFSQGKLFEASSFDSTYWVQKNKEWVREDFSLDTTCPEIKERISEAREFLRKEFMQRRGLKEFFSRQIEEGGELAPLLRKELRSKSEFGKLLNDVMAKKWEEGREKGEGRKGDKFADSISFVGEVFFGGDYFNNAVLGNYMYATGICGVEIFDVSDPSNPKRVGYCDTPGEPYGIEIKGNYAYVADGIAGLTVIDITNPVAPVVVTSYQPFGYCWNIRIRNDTAFIADFIGFSLVDIGNPLAPQLVGKCLTLGLSMDVEVVGNYAYVVDLISISKTGTFYTVDITVPFFPEIAGQCQMPEYSFPWAVCGNNQYAWVTDFISIVPVNVGNPSSPSVIGRGFSLGLSLGIKEDGDWGYTASGIGLSKICFWIPSIPFPIGFCYIPTFVQNLDVQGDLAYVIGLRGFGIVDKGGWFGLDLEGYWESPGYAKRSCVQGDYAYVAADWGGLVVVDVAVPSNPRIVGRCKTGGLFAIAKDVDVAGNYAYVANDLMGLAVVDISNPVEPYVVASCGTKWAAYGVDVVGSNCYIADNIRGLTLVDVSNPLSPSVIDNVYTWGISQGVEVEGGYAYVADNFYGVTAVDVSSMSVTEHCWTTPGLAMDIGVKDGFVYAANYWSGLAVIDATCLPDSMWVRCKCGAPGWAHGVAIECNTYAYVANGAGLTVFNVSDADTCWEIDTYHTKHTAYDAYVVEELIYVPNKYWYTILSFEKCPASIAESSELRVTSSELRVYPNPFTQRTVIQYAVSSKQYGESQMESAPTYSLLPTICIYDLSGRLVKTLMSDQGPRPTQGAVEWDAKDDKGRAVASGIYFIKFEAGDYKQTKKIVLTR